MTYLSNLQDKFLPFVRAKYMVKLLTMNHARCPKQLILMFYVKPLVMTVEDMSQKLLARNYAIPTEYEMHI